ncbi:MAG: serine hydrolase domain-containing protein [Phycisphaeraceae bacterium]
MSSATGQAQQRIAQLLTELTASGNDLGVQVAVYQRGELVVDAWAGSMDVPGGRQVDGDTLFPVFSTGKGVAATAVHVLAQRGVLSYDAPLAHCWPEFAVHGKGGITLRHALNHTAGLPDMPPCQHMTDVCDWDLMCRRVAALLPLWPAGEQMRYHAITFSWLVGEPARRIDGRPFARIVDEEIARPLGLERDLFFGITDDLRHRIATLQPLKNPALPAVEDPAIPHIVRPLEDLMNQPAVQRACIPASNAIASARAIARHYAALLDGGVDGVQLLTPDTLRAATTLTQPGGVPLEQLSARRGLGYNLSGPDHAVASVFGHGGYGGSTGYADARRRLAVGVTKNVMDAPRSVVEEVKAILAGLGDLPGR